MMADGSRFSAALRSRAADLPFMLLSRDRLKVVLEDDRFVLGDPAAEKVAGEIVALRQRIHELCPQCILCELTSCGVMLVRQGHAPVTFEQPRRQSL